MTYPRLDKHGANEAYLSLREIKAGDAKKQIPVSVNGEPALVVDLGDKDEVLGIEFLDANKQLGAPRE